MIFIFSLILAKYAFLFVGHVYMEVHKLGVASVLL